MAKVYILRGLPGSGKSTWAKKQPNAVICSADNYHMVNGEYKFKVENVAKAHQNCLREFLYELQIGSSETIIVDNTNTTDVEIAPYLRLAEAYNYEVEIVEFECCPSISKQMNIHNVPSFVIDRMYSNLIKPLGFKCKVRYITNDWYNK